MRVLWFTNILLPEYAQALGRVGHNSGGWMQSLVDAIRRYAPEIQLTVVCQGYDAPKTVNGVVFRSLLPLRGHVYAPKNEKSFLSAMRTIVETTRPDIIHFHGTENCLQAYYARLKLNIPSITSIQGILGGILPHVYGGLMPTQLGRYRNWFNVVMGRPFESIGRHYERRASFENEIFMRGGCFCGRTNWDETWVRARNPDSRYYFVGEVLRDAFYSKVERVINQVRPPQKTRQTRRVQVRSTPNGQ